MSDFMRYVARLMEAEGVDPEDPKEVQGYIDQARRLLRKQYNSENFGDKRTQLYQLRMEGAIEDQKHIQLYGDLYA